MENLLSLANRKEWRSWLEKNFDKRSSVWLTISRKGSKRKGVTLKEAVEEAICFGWIDGKLQRNDKENFFLRFSIRKARSVWSKINRERAEMLMASGQMTSAGLIKVEDAKRSGWWDKAYTNRNLEEMPLDLKEALIKEKKAWQNFQGFANTYQNMYIGWVNNARNPETRKKRIKKVVEQSIKNKKLIFL